MTEAYDKNKAYTLEEAVGMLPELSTSKFVGSVDVDIVLDTPEKHKKTAIAGSVSLPHQVGEAKKVVVLAEAGDVTLAKQAGAVAAGLDDVVKKIEDGSLEFDVVIATPTVMPKIAKLGRVLGPKGLMPNPNNGTVTKDVEGTIKEFASGKQNFKKSEQQAIRAKVAKLDMKPEAIKENITEFVKAVVQSSRKIGANPIKKITLSPTMGKGVKLDISSLMEEIA